MKMSNILVLIALPFFTIGIIFMGMALFIVDGFPNGNFLVNAIEAIEYFIQENWS